MSGIYQSRLFNFLNRQKIRLSTQLGIRFRHLQLATKTGVKALLYPVYLIAKNGVSFRRQLKSDSQSAKTPGNISGERIITENDFWLEDGEKSLPGQADALSGLTKTHQANSELSQARQARSGAIAPMRFFQRIFNWVKTSPLASGSSQGLESVPEQESFSGLIRRAITYFFGEKQQLVSGKNQEALPSVQATEVGTIQLAPVHLTLINDSRSQESKLTLFSKVGGWLEKVKATITRSHDPALESRNEESLAIQVLIRRAIAYFFGNRQQLLSSKNQEALPSSHPLHNNFALPFSNLNFPLIPKTFTATLPFNCWNLKLPNPTKKDDILSFTKTELTALESASLNICSGNILATNKTKADNSINIPLEFSSDFWEAEVITVGYVKNLLERILEFLDKITWWIEKQFIKLWQLFQSLTMSLLSRLTSQIKATDQ